MITPDVITDTIMEWLQSLDYEYMLLHIMISYGLYYSKNMKWVSDKLGGLPYSIWIVGGILALIEIGRFLPFIEGGGAAAVVQKFVSIFHSYILIQVFVEDIVKTVHKWVDIFRRKEKIDK